MIYTKESINHYALYHAIKLIDIDNTEYKGWLVPQENSYMLLPTDDNNFNRYIFKRSHIKAIYHLTNCVLIPKKSEVLENER